MLIWTIILSIYLFLFILLSITVCSSPSLQAPPSSLDTFSCFALIEPAPDAGISAACALALGYHQWRFGSLRAHLFLFFLMSWLFFHVYLSFFTLDLPYLPPVPTQLDGAAFLLQPWPWPPLPPPVVAHLGEALFCPIRSPPLADSVWWGNLPFQLVVHNTSFIIRLSYARSDEIIL